MADTARRRLRILSIAHTAVSSAAGRLRYAPLAEHADLDVHLVVPARWYQFGRWTEADPPGDPGITVHVMPIRVPRAGRMMWYLHHYPGLARLVQSLRPDVIHLWEEPWSVVALHAAWLRDRFVPDAALVIEVDQNIMKWLPPPFETIRRHVLRNTDLILARSDEAINVVRRAGFRGPATLIGYGVALDTFRPVDRNVARETFGLGGFVLGYVGRIVEEKGLDDAIAALARIDAPVTLALLGEGPHRAALEAHAARLGVADRLRWFGWAKPGEVARFMAALDVLVLLTRTTPDVREQFGRVIVEAQACATPVVGSDSGAIPSVVGAGGWIVPERDPTALAALIRRLAADSDLVSATGAAGLRQAEQRYTFARVAQTLADSWREAAARHHCLLVDGSDAVG